MTEGSEWVPKKDGEWYQGSDGMWYCWPSRDPYPMAPVNPDAPDVPDAFSHVRESAQSGSALAKVDAVAGPTGPTETRSRYRFLLPIAVGGLVLVTLMAVVAVRIVGREETIDAPLRKSVQAVSAKAAGTHRVTLAGGVPGVSYAVVWRNLSRTEFATNVVVHAALVDSDGATVHDLTQTIPLIPPAMSVAVGGEREDGNRVVDVTVGSVDIGAWQTEAELTTYRVENLAMSAPADGVLDVTAQVVPLTPLTRLPKLRAVVVFFDRQDRALGGASVDLAERADTNPFDVTVPAHPLPRVKRARLYLVPLG